MATSRMRVGAYPQANCMIRSEVGASLVMGYLSGIAAAGKAICEIPPMLRIGTRLRWPRQRRLIEHLRIYFNGKSVLEEDEKTLLSLSPTLPHRAGFSVA